MAYGNYSELELCKMIAESDKFSQMLFDAASMPIEYDSFELEKLTIPHHKRIDIAYMKGDEVSCIVEAQDATGNLDPLHASKVSWYSFSGQCSNVIILAKTIDESLREYVKWENLHPHKNYCIVQPIFHPESGELICFNPYYTPEDSYEFAQLEKSATKQKIDDNVVEIRNFLSKEANLPKGYSINKGYAYYKGAEPFDKGTAAYNIMLHFNNATSFTINVPPYVWEETLKLPAIDAERILKDVFGEEIKMKSNRYIGGNISHEGDYLNQVKTLLTKIPEVFALHK